MKTYRAFLLLIRWPNLLFIALTQVLFKFFIVDRVYNESALPFPLSVGHLILLCSASLLIAAAGYIINDYFDLNIDLVNKPERQIVDTIINRRWAIAMHVLFSLAGIVISIYIGIKTNLLIAAGNILSVLLLWLYSTTFKKKLLIGNIVISLLTAWVIIVLYLAIDTHFSFYNTSFFDRNLPLHQLLRYAIMYSSFAFILSLVREVVKDMEDIRGDAKYGCATMPIKWGIPVSKVFAAVWIIVLVGGITAIILYIMQLGWWLAVVYLSLAVLIPLLMILQRLYKAREKNDYHSLSSLLKLVMLAGILSMLFLKIHT